MGYRPKSQNEAMLLATGDETVDRERVNSNSALTASTQNLRLAFFKARKTETTTQVKIISGATAAGATPSIARIGLWLVGADPTGNLTLVAATANDTALLATQNTEYTKSWSASYDKVAGLWYAVGVLVVTAATAPTLQGASLFAASNLAGPIGSTPPVAATLGSQADLGSLASTITRASLSYSVGGKLYANVLP